MNQLVDRVNRLVFPFGGMIIQDNFDTIKKALNTDLVLSWDVSHCADVSDFPSANGYIAHQRGAEFIAVEFECSQVDGALRQTIDAIFNAVNSYPRIEKA